MTDIFISYKREERAIVLRIASELRLLGFSVWFDGSLSAGEAFSDEIDREARRAKAVLVCWSPLAASSSWVKSEALIGFNEKKLVTVYVAGGSKFDPPAPFNSLHTEDLRGWIASAEGNDPAWSAVLKRIGTLTDRKDIVGWAELDGEPSVKSLQNWQRSFGASSPLAGAVEAQLIKAQDKLRPSTQRDSEVHVESADAKSSVRTSRPTKFRPERFLLMSFVAILSLAVTAYTFISVVGQSQSNEESAVPAAETFSVVSQPATSSKAVTSSDIDKKDKDEQVAPRLDGDWRTAYGDVWNDAELTRIIRLVLPKVEQAIAANGPTLDGQGRIRDALTAVASPVRTTELLGDYTCDMFVSYGNDFGVDTRYTVFIIGRHQCRVEQRGDRVFLSKISGSYRFSAQVYSDSDTRLMIVGRWTDTYSDPKEGVTAYSMERISNGKYRLLAAREKESIEGFILSRR